MFDDWVDNLYSFPHLINPSKPQSESAKLLFTLAMEQVQSPDEPAEEERPNEAHLDYSDAPRGDKAVLADKRLKAAHDWLNSERPPDNYTDKEKSLTI